MNRIALAGGLIGSLGFFFLPLLELKPNRLASGIPVFLLELPGDYRYLILFGLALAPLVVSFRPDRQSRGWLLVALGQVLIVLTLLLPAVAGEKLLVDAGSVLGTEVVVRSPRLLPSSALALGLVGGYVVLFGGLRDLRLAETGRTPRLLVAAGTLVLTAPLFASGRMNVYSVMVELQANGALLGQRFIEHVTFVGVSLAFGTLIGISLGLWASRRERVAQGVLYIVGIIQTIPSLALFGLMLVPLARLGDQPISNLMLFFVIIVPLASLLLFAYSHLKAVPVLRAALVASAAFAFGLALSLFTVVLISFSFRIFLVVLTTDRLYGQNGMIILLIALALSMTYLQRRIRRWRQAHVAAQAVVWAFAGVLLFSSLVQAGQEYLSRARNPVALTIRDLGVSGIGTAPALIALTLYSLLPLVRNTYVGLRTVDQAVIESGRGMGMTPRQIFFQIELPLALPVIMSGARNAGIALIGIGAIATVIGGGGLGDFIIQGIVNTSIDMILLGAIPAVVLAILLDTGLRTLELALTSPGIRTMETIAEG